MPAKTQYKQLKKMLSKIGKMIGKNIDCSQWNIETVRALSAVSLIMRIPKVDLVKHCVALQLREWSKSANIKSN